MLIYSGYHGELISSSPILGLDAGMSSSNAKVVHVSVRPIVQLYTEVKTRSISNESQKRRRKFFRPKQTVLLDNH